MAVALSGDTELAPTFRYGARSFFMVREPVFRPPDVGFTEQQQVGFWPAVDFLGHVMSTYAAVADQLFRVLLACSTL